MADTQKDFLRFLISNAGKKFTIKDIAEKLGINKTTLAYHATRLFAWIDTDDKNTLFAASNKGYNRFIWCKEKPTEDINLITNKQSELFTEFVGFYNNIKATHKGRFKAYIESTGKRAKAEDDKPKDIIPAPLINNNGSPIDIPLRISITIAVNFQKG